MALIVYAPIWPIYYTATLTYHFGNAGELSAAQNHERRGGEGFFPNRMASRLQIQGDESVLLRVTHSNLKSFSAEVHFSVQVTISVNQLTRV